MYHRMVHVTGKIPLREAFPESISAWRRKDPIEVGSGSRRLSVDYFNELVFNNGKIADCTVGFVL
eukprot:Pgem_evm1s7374